MNKSITNATILLLIAGVFFVTNDAIINFLSQTEVKFFHFIFYGIPVFLCFPLYLIITGKLIKNLKCSNYYPPIIRGILNIPLPFTAFVALENIKLPEFTTLNMTAPLMGTLFAIFFLKEKLNKLTYLSLFTGFIGVSFVIQPGFDTFNIFYLVTLFGVLLITITTFIVNKYNDVASNIGYFLYGGILVHLISIPLFILNPLTVSLLEYSLIIIASIFVNLAMFFATIAFRIAQKHYASVFPLAYLQVLWSSLIGIYIFNEYMNLYAYIGSFLIVMSGIISLPSQIKQLRDS
tara:strand:+ start:2660 stop:3535 length:876 start_codon:yes stop_codon:yes gene_type:complete